ncbi:hypothetical protein, partial [Streptomyces sp. NPDC006334]|uniref:hypothetical protein n=1 Tax=Streptomyces sp. NPDC006334 TaxID=3156754 RepID=UPI0033AA0ABA
MDDAVLAIILTAVAMLLGAAILSIGLLYKGWQKHRREINRLQAEITAQKIAAITAQATAPPAAAPARPALAAVPEPEGASHDYEPVKRRKHLSLYMGGGFAAFFL